MKQRILILEDELIIREALRKLFEQHGYSVREAESIEQAREEIELKSFNLVIADLHLPDGIGSDIIPKCNDIPVLIMTSYASVNSAVESMKLGAVDYIAKPFDYDEMLLTVERILKQKLMSRQNEALRADKEDSYPVSGILGNSPVMQEVFSIINKVAPTDSNVLILGESGTGKELVARAIHENSLYSQAAIIPVNCAAIPEGLIESELFGHEKGAFTGAVNMSKGLVEAADGGTLFLDEIGELPLSAQARLLRVLQEGEIRRVGSSQTRKVNVRLIAATHRDLQQLVTDGEFREDLYFRLRVIEIILPPLRQRGNDIVTLIEYMLDKVCRRLNRSPLKFTPQSFEALKCYSWPGNVRELENVIERATILCEGIAITPDLLSLDLMSGFSEREDNEKNEENMSLDDYFRHSVLKYQNQLSETELAKQLGISRKNLWERRQKFNIPRS